MAKGFKSGGRTQGTPNKVTAEIRSMFEQLVSNNLQTIQSDLDALSPRWRIHYLIELTKFVTPTLRASEIDLNTPPTELKNITIEIVRNEDENENKD